MAHFCRIEQETDPTGFTTDTLWIVKQVVVVSNDTETSNGKLGDNDMHVDGETWCQNFFGMIVTGKQLVLLSIEYLL